MKRVAIGNRYKLLKQIGKGGMSNIYWAIDQRLNRPVAIKVLRSDSAGDPHQNQRFFTEAKTLSKLNHPNIVTIYDCCARDSNIYWLATEYLKGITLSKFFDQQGNKPLHPIIATIIVSEICSALDYIHSKGIIHRDIKCSNIMLSGDKIKLLDFGISKNMAKTSITSSDIIMGTFHYMAPEQIMGVKVDARTDIYSLTVLYYKLLTGRLPYDGYNPALLINKVLAGKLKTPKEIIPNLPEFINQIAIKGLKKAKRERFQNIASLKKSLDLFLTKYGFMESDIELRRFLSDKNQFSKRLKRMDAIIQQQNNFERIRDMPARSELPTAPSIRISATANETDPKRLTGLMRGVKGGLLTKLIRIRLNMLESNAKMVAVKSRMVSRKPRKTQKPRNTGKIRYQGGTYTSFIRTNKANLKVAAIVCLIFISLFVYKMLKPNYEKFYSRIRSQKLQLVLKDIESGVAEKYEYLSKKASHSLSSKVISNKLDKINNNVTDAALQTYKKISI